MKKYQYYYVTFLTPNTLPGATFIRDTEHPLHPEVLANVTQYLATQVGLVTGQITDAGSVVITNVIELPLSVAKAKWPKDFEEKNE